MEIFPDVWPVRALAREVGGTPGIVSSRSLSLSPSRAFEVGSGQFFFSSLPAADVDFPWDFPGIVT